ncbi:MAG: hypothetical protein ACOYMF_06610 [Bacteroidales bacterium]
MRKIQLLAGLLLITGLGLFTSCKKDSTTEDLTPSINFIGGAGFVTGDVTKTVGELFYVGVNASANSTSGKSLTNFKVVRTYDNTPLTWDTTINTDNFNYQFQAYANALPGPERWTFTITDKDGQSKELTFEITTIGTASDIITYSDKILGSYDNATIGSSFASSTGAIYMMPDAKINATKIDWLYFYGVTNLATLAAPDDAAAATLFNNATNGLQTWSVLNATRFRLVTEGAVWDNITTAAQIAAIATGTTETKVNDLQTGNIVAFKTANNKLGVIAIGAITTGAAGTITYTVKVQK